jgi:hypothetical protein
VSAKLSLCVTEERRRKNSEEGLLRMFSCEDILGGSVHTVKKNAEALFSSCY